MENDILAALQKGEQIGSRYKLVTPQTPPRGLSGSHISQHAGSSLEFREHREYQPGDDLRRIDWGVYARSDKLSVKLYQKEVHPHLDLIVDTSLSMALEGTAKAEATAGLAAVLATVASNAGYSCKSWWTGEGCHPILNGSARPSSWDGFSFDQTISPHEAFAKRPPTLRPHGVRVFVSDLLWMGDPMTMLGYLSHKATRVLILQVLAKQDVDPPTSGQLRLVDSETGEEREIYIDATIRRQYLEGFHRHLDNWHRASRQVGAIMQTIVAEPFVEHWQLDELVATETLAYQ